MLATLRAGRVQTSSLTVPQVIRPHLPALAAGAAPEGAGDCRAEDGDGIGDVALRSDWGIRGVDNHGIGEALGGPGVAGR